ncbi:hypothetical protein SAMN06265365_13819 [Tistlia consotensis]|uniref:DUF4189 domain-containing protein n=1 Tax=Tistlia consotensis USBA 355 TaxID=560819 RepID=A0A1Y6CMX7_9PROT|nr:hypothetical protein [Tistlia consotensis]SMF77785.1 hypothetical protein SAMN05428998_13744 [Tistlia consotensis USBA 355]SNS20578.1 hypothetical protein SAMN06265365_13819 [Tistlia consotensis]
MPRRLPATLALCLAAAALAGLGPAGRAAAQTVKPVEVQPVQPVQPVTPLLPAKPAQAPKSAQSDAERQVTALMYHRLMAEVLRTGIRQQTQAGGSAVGEVNPYPSVTSGKALAVCVNWPKTTLDRVNWGGFAYRYGATVSTEQLEALKARTLDDCRHAYAGRDCGCQLLDVDDRDVLEVPESFMKEYGRF